MLDRVSSSARAAIGRQDWGRPIDAAETVLRHRPDDPRALFALGVASGAKGRLGAAGNALLGSMERAPGDCDTWYNPPGRRRRRPLPNGFSGPS